ncbi:MAG: pentapeptide repeat-containing protein [Bacteroidetes bacterium]|nr:pentapeptide repeat-containing protein [Bacteroidota bacterium]
MLNTKTIGNKISEARKKINISQTQLAEQLFISSQAVGKWECGESMPDITTFNRLAEILGVDLNYFSDSFKPIEKEIATNVGKGDDDIFSKIKDTMGLNWNMSGENYVESDFSGIKNVKEKLSGSSFKKCKLIKADLSDITFKGNSIQECDFSNANLRNSKFYGSKIKVTSFVDASFIDAVIVASEIRNCDFSNANLSGIEVSTSEFRNNKIENTNWLHASFKDTQFTEIIFSSLLEECSFTSCAFARVTFKNAIIKNSFFKYNDLKRVEFIDYHADKLTYEFLKNCKADLSGVTLLGA